ncbi:hypothetical protein HPP92_028244 [Vanilla planifolia]|uniref:Uncharacterized protein n=1 Tax=Vanilla planifolia TaxID=51239 RepID=A0A835PBQ9_VANPL|nr:hypothetical protein HPP92_028244 [Vanilla planifolia]
MAPIREQRHPLCRLLVHLLSPVQLGVWDFGSKNVLFLKLYSKVPGCTIRRSYLGPKPGGLGERVKNGNGFDGIIELKLEELGKLSKVVDTVKWLRFDDALHWLVTGCKLGVGEGRLL